MSVKPSPGVSRLSSALASNSGATVRMADSRLATARPLPFALLNVALQVLHHVDQLAPDVLHIGERPVDLGVARQLEVGRRLGRIGHSAGRHRTRLHGYARNIAAAG